MGDLRHSRSEMPGQFQKLQQPKIKSLNSQTSLVNSEKLVDELVDNRPKSPKILTPGSFDHQEPPKKQKTFRISNKKEASKIKALKNDVDPATLYFRAMTYVNKNRPEISAMSHFSNQSSRRCNTGRVTDQEYTSGQNGPNLDTNQAERVISGTYPRENENQKHAAQFTDANLGRQTEPITKSGENTVEENSDQPMTLKPVSSSTQLNLENATLATSPSVDFIYKQPSTSNTLMATFSAFNHDNKESYFNDQKQTNATQVKFAPTASLSG